MVVQWPTRGRESPPSLQLTLSTYENGILIWVRPTLELPPEFVEVLVEQEKTCA
jgi:hypothetical protein